VLLPSLPLAAAAAAAAGLRCEDLIHVNQMGDVGKQAVALMPEHAQMARYKRFLVRHEMGHSRRAAVEPPMLSCCII